MTLITPLSILLAAVLAVSSIAAFGEPTAQTAQPTGDTKMIPRIAEPWWTIAGNPDLGELSKENQQPVDFAVWQAADGTWQLQSCIRGTECGGKTRLFYRWEGQKLTDPDWKPVGIAMQADPKYGETEGGLQAPHVVLKDGTFYMFYGDWANICLATSKDGKKFERRVLPNGKTGMFSEGEGANTRDAMALLIGDTWYCYYTAYPGDLGADYVRTSKDLIDWSKSTKVAFGGEAGTRKGSAECPFVVQRDGYYYLFRTQHYSDTPISRVYRSKDPMDFGVEDDKCLIGSLPVAAPEIIEHEGQYYIACLLPNLKGIRMAKLEWVKE